jgi:hypothetical protein
LGQAQPREYDVSDYAAKLGERKKEILKRTRDGLDFCKGQAANQPAMGKRGNALPTKSVCTLLLLKKLLTTGTFG